MLADTAKLAIELNLTGNAKSSIAGVSRSLTGLSRQSGQIGQGFRTMGTGALVAARNLLVLGGVVGAGLVAGLISSVREGQAAAKVQTIYANAIANSGKVSTQYVAILKTQQTALMNLAGIDDELIKSEQTRLIQMGLTGDAVAKLTPLILDASKATGKDLLTVTIAAGKAANGQATALQRLGIVIDKTKFKIDPLAATIDALNSRFGGTTKALSGSLDARLGAFRENLANIREEAGMKLLPALTRIVDVAGKDLVPAFGKFIDRILPSIISGVDKFASILENGGAERGIKAITDALGPMVDLLKIAAAPIKAIVSAFLSLPSQVQGVLIGAFAINKLSGGLLATGVGQIGKGLIGGVAGGLLQRGGTPANPLFVADVTGGLGGIARAAGGALGGASLATAAIAALPVVAGAAIVYMASQNKGAYDPRNLRQRQFTTVAQTTALFGAGALGGVNDRGSSQGLTPMGPRGASMEQARGIQSGVLARAVAAGFHPSTAAIQRTMDKNAAHAITVEQRIAAATRDTAIGVSALPGQLRNALGGILYTGGGRPSKDDPIMPRKLSGVQRTQDRREGNITVNANVAVSTRDVNTAQNIKRRYGPTPTQAGAA